MTLKSITNCNAQSGRITPDTPSRPYARSDGIDMGYFPPPLHSGNVSLMPRDMAQTGDARGSSLWEIQSNTVSAAKEPEYQRTTGLSASDDLSSRGFRVSIIMTAGNCCAPCFAAFTTMASMLSTGARAVRERTMTYLDASCDTSL